MMCSFSGAAALGLTINVQEVSTPVTQSVCQSAVFKAERRKTLFRPLSIF